MKDRTVTRLHFALVDKDPARAGTIFAGLSRYGRGVIVSEGLDDPAVDRSIVLAADEPGAIAEVVERMKQMRIAAKVIAYGETASPHRIVRAMAAGAADYLIWPFNLDALVAAADAATAADAVD